MDELGSALLELANDLERRKDEKLIEIIEKYSYPRVKRPWDKQKLDHAGIVVVEFNETVKPKELVWWVEQWGEQIGPKITFKLP